MITLRFPNILDIPNNEFTRDEILNMPAEGRLMPPNCFLHHSRR